MADLISMLAAAAGAAAGGGETDPFFQDTVLLLHGDGTNGAQNNTFLDSSTNNFTITRNGNTTQGSFSPFSKPDGRWGNYFDGSGDSLTCSNGSQFAFGTGDFTIEFWVYWTYTQYNAVISTSTNTQNSGSWLVGYSNTANYFGFCYDIPGFNFIGADFSSYHNSWTHVAVTRSGTDLKLWFNGSVVDSTTNSTDFNYTSGNVKIGQRWSNQDAYSTTGYLSNLRVIKGTAVYTSAFTPPTAPLTAITNTSLLTCQSNRFVDNSTNNFAITRNGDVKVTPFSPFPITTEYSPSVNGGSGYFDGSGDYLTVPDDAALEVPTQDFTIEAWVYLSSLPTSSSQYTIIQKGRTGTSNFEYSFEIDNNSGSMRLVCRTSSNGSSLTTANGSTISLVAGSWNHVAVTRTSTTASFWFNGVAAGTGTVDGTTYTGSAVVAIGANDAGSSLLVGYMAFRFVKGSQVYTSAFTPPTAPLTAIANTSLLLNFTNAGIFDNTAFNVLETVGNAQIDTTTKKYGTGSMEFDGTGDWLKAPVTDFIQGTEAFTVECWINLSNTSATKGIIFGVGNNSFGLRVGQSYLGNVNGLNIVKSGVGDLEYCAFTFSTSTWYHIAVCRSGTTIYFFVDGQQQTTQGSGGGSFSFTKPTSFYVGCNNDTNEPFAGFIDDLRITKGVARYTAAFTPPTAAFPNIGS